MNFREPRLYDRDLRARCALNEALIALEMWDHVTRWIRTSARRRPYRDHVRAIIKDAKRSSQYDALVGTFLHQYYFIRR